MPSRVEAWLDRRARWALILPLALVTGLLLTQMMTIGGAEGAAAPLDVRTWYTAAEVDALLGALTPAQRSQAAWLHLSLDVLFPLLYGLLFALLLRKAWPQSRLWLLAPAVVLADLLENALLAALYWGYPALLGLTPLAAFVTAFKWTLVALSLFYLVRGGFDRWTARALQRLQDD